MMLIKHCFSKPRLHFFVFLIGFFQFIFSASGITITGITIQSAIVPPTITGFGLSSSSAQMGAAAPTIIPPTSNSAGPITYSSSNLSVATIAGATITLVGVGSTNILATQAANGRFSTATVSTALNVAKQTQATLRVTPSVATISEVTGTATLSTSGGSGTGAVTYAVTAGSCTISGNTLTAGNVIETCSVSATKAGDVNYTPATASTSVSVIQRSQATLIATPAAASISTVSGRTTLSTSGGSGTGAVTYAVTTGSCTISGNALTAGRVAETCTVTATKAADASYTATSATTSVAVILGSQATLVATPAAASISAVSGRTTLSTSGGSGTGAVPYAVTAGSCTISGNTLTAGNLIETCSVTATKAGDASYNPATATTSVAITALGTQAAPTFSTTSPILFGTTVTLASSGATAIYYTTDGSTPTTASTNQAVTPLVINAAVTVKAIAVRTGYANSTVSTRSYVQSVALVPSSVVLAAGATNPVGTVTNVSIPAAGSTDASGKVFGWVNSSASHIKFTVANAAGTTSAITINGSPYVSGSDYEISSDGLLSIVLTTTQTGAATAVRTFSISVSNLPFGFIRTATLGSTGTIGSPGGWALNGPGTLIWSPNNSNNAHAGNIAANVADCTALNAAGMTGWRLPSQGELSGLQNTNSALAIAANWRQDITYSSTPSSTNPAKGYFIMIGTNAVYEPNSWSGYKSCVHD